MIARLWTYLHQSPGWTWIGHGLQGFWWGVVAALFGASMWLPFIYCVFHFGEREWKGIKNSFKLKDWPNLKDGVLDFATPLIGLLILVLINR